MTTAGHLAAIELLRTRGFDGEPDFHLAELATSEDFWEDDGTRRVIVEDRYEAERDGLGFLLTARWGTPGARPRARPGTEHGGRVDTRAWSTLSCHTPNLRLWRADGCWIGPGVSQWDEELPIQLLAVLTTVDPPT